MAVRFPTTSYSIATNVPSGYTVLVTFPYTSYWYVSVRTLFAPFSPLRVSVFETAFPSLSYANVAVSPAPFVVDDTLLEPSYVNCITVPMASVMLFGRPPPRYSYRFTLPSASVICVSWPDPS